MAEGKRPTKPTKRKTPREQMDLKARLDKMEDTEVLGLLEGVGKYVSDHFEFEEVKDSKDDLHEEEGTDGDRSSGFAKFFGGE
jgi:hypothetical protein